MCVGGVCVCVCGWVGVGVGVGVWVWMGGCVRAYLCTCVRACACAHVYMHTYMCIYMQACVHVVFAPFLLTIVMNKSPTDAGLQGIVSDPNIGGFWTQLATAVGVPAPFIKRCEQNPTPGVTALRYWVNGNVDDVDTTWEFLLDTMREDPNLGKDVVDKLEKKIEGHRHWTQW